MTPTLKVQLFLKGRPMGEFTFCQETVTIGRDPASRIVIDNAGVSREQARIVPSPDGWVLEDRGSANGTWLNQQRVQHAPIKDRDEITIGKFTLSIGLEADRTIRPLPPVRPRPGMPAEVDGTVALTRGQLAGMLASYEEEAAAAPPSVVPYPGVPRHQPAPARSPIRQRLLLAGVVILAMILGGVLSRLLLR